MRSVCGEDKDLASVSDEKGSPLFVERLLSGPYLGINSCSFLMMVSAVLEDILWINGYLLNVSTNSKYSIQLK